MLLDVLKVLFVVFVAGFIFYFFLLPILAMITKDPKLTARAAKIYKWMETSTVRNGKGELIYDAAIGTYPLLRKVMEVIKVEVEASLHVSLDMKYYSTWSNETELSVPYDFFWLGKELPKKGWLPADCEIWFKVIVGFFENPQEPGGKMVYYHIKNNEIREIVERNMKPYLERFDAKMVELP